MEEILSFDPRIGFKRLKGKISQKHSGVFMESVESIADDDHYDKRGRNLPQTPFPMCVW